MNRSRGKGDRTGEAKDAFRAAIREEMARMAQMGSAMKDIAAAADRTADRKERAALQDRNLEAYATMVGDAGAHALSKTTELVARLGENLAKSEAERAAGDADGRAEDPLESVEAALAEIRAAREAGDEAFLSELANIMGVDPHRLEPFE